MSAGYLVTGAAGFIGSHVCDRLIREGHRVRAVDRFSSYYARADKEANIAALRHSPAFELIECDLAEADITGMLDGVDAVIHLAAQPGVRASWGDGFVDYVRDNIIATQRLFDALVANPLATSGGIRPRPSGIKGSTFRAALTKAGRPPKRAR